MSLFLAYLNGAQKSRQYSNISIIKFILFSVVSIAWMFMLKDKRYLGSVYTTLIINALFGLIIAIFVYLRPVLNIKYNFNHLKYGLAFGLPLVPHALSGVLLSYFDRIIINQLNGPKDAGLYSFAYNIGMVMYIVVMSFNKSWNPYFYKNMNEKKFTLIQVEALKYIKYIYFIAVLLVFFSAEIVKVMANPKYYDSISIIPIIVCSYVLVYLYALYVNFAFYKKKTYLISINTLAAAIINIVLNYIFIPKFGYRIAAYTTFVSYIVLLMLHYINTRVVLKYNVIAMRSLLAKSVVYIIAIAIYYLLHLIKLNTFCAVAIKIIIVAIIIPYTFKKQSILHIKI